MSLGLTRDSVNDLASLRERSEEASKGKKPSTSALSKLSLPQEEGRTAVVSIEEPKKERNNASPTTVTTSSAPNSKNKNASSYGQYSGFAVDYAEYEKYGGMTYSDPYSDGSLLLGEKTNKEGFWCCIFPWASQQKEIEVEPELLSQESQDGTDNEVASTRSDDDLSTGSAVFGEKLTDKDRAAVLARLGMATPEMPPDIIEPLHQHEPSNGLEYESPPDEKVNDENVKPRSILRNSLVPKPSPAVLRNSRSSMSSQNDPNQRRSLFPQQYSSEQKPQEKKEPVRFAPMARVVTVKSKNEMTEHERSHIWWQKRDYDDFKKTGRIIARAMCEGGSEIWLASNNAWEQGSGQNGLTRTSSDGTRAIHSHDRNEIQNDFVSNGDKWWHKFGHSRRGLEHIASVEEGRQRQSKVRNAIRVVIDEQRRQKIYRKEDQEKLRMLSLQYTTWARDLALAAAASDAEAVEVDFNENRKSREFYLLKHAKDQGGFSKQLPSFMMPVSRSPQVLDHHTSTQIRFRRKQARVAPSPHDEAVHDEAGVKANLAKKAAGFGTQDSDVSAILSGMGAVDKTNTMPSMQPHPTSVGAH